MMCYRSNSIKIITLIAVAIFVGWVSSEDASAQNVSNNVDIHGFVSQGFLYTTDNNFLADDTDNGSFEFNELGINFSTQVEDNLRLGMQLFSRDLGDIDNNKVVIDWAYGDYRFRDWLGIRAGIVKQPGLLFSEVRDVDALRTCVVLPQSVYQDNLRESYLAVQGIDLYGNVPLDVLGSITYRLLAGGANVPSDGGTAQYVMNIGGFSKVNSFDFDELYAGFLEWSPPVDGLKMIIAYGLTKSDIEVVAGPNLGSGLSGTVLEGEFSKVDSLTTGIEYSIGELMILAEARRGGIVSELMLPGMTIKKTKQSLGYYVGASYRFSELFELGSYYAAYYPDRHDMNGNELEAQGLDSAGAWQRDFTLSNRFDLTDSLIFKLEGHYIKGFGLLDSSLNPDGFKDGFFMFVSKVSYMF